MMLKTEAPAVKIGDRVRWGDLIGVVEGFPTHGIKSKPGAFSQIDPRGIVSPSDLGERYELDPATFFVQVRCECGEVICGSPPKGGFHIL